MGLPVVRLALNFPRILRPLPPKSWNYRCAPPHGVWHPSFCLSNLTSALAALEFSRCRLAPGASGEAELFCPAPEKSPNLTNWSATPITSPWWTGTSGCCGPDAELGKVWGERHKPRSLCLQNMR